jgi:hypothetical protein
MTDDEPNRKMYSAEELVRMARRDYPCAPDADELLKNLPLSRLDVSQDTTPRDALKTALVEATELLTLSEQSDEEHTVSQLLRCYITAISDLIDHADHLAPPEISARANAAVRELLFSLKPLLRNSPDGSRFHKG